MCTTLLRGEGVGVRKVNSAEGSQAVLARPSGKGTLTEKRKFWEIRKIKIYRTIILPFVLYGCET